MKRHFDYYDSLAEGIQYFYCDVHNKNNINKAWKLLIIANDRFIPHEALQYTPDVFLFFAGLARFEGQNRISSDTESFHKEEDAIKINPNHVIYYYERGRMGVRTCYPEPEIEYVNERKANLKKAVKYFEKAIELDPAAADAGFYYYRGRAKFEAPISRGFFKPDEYDKAGAIVDIEQAISMDDSKVEYYVDLAFMYFELAQESSENYSQAVILLKKPSILKKMKNTGKNS
jgi:tetratricopeptide (TPR) repeat protein